MRKWFIGLIGFFYLFILGAGEVKANNINPAEFVSKTEKYRGKQITLKGHISTGIFASDEKSLQDYKGKTFELYVYGTEDDIKIFILEHFSNIPKAAYLDKVVVTFICKDGELQHGNVAVSIKLFH